MFEEPGPQPTTPLRSRGWRWLRRAAWGLFLLLAAILLVLHLPPVQRSLAERGLQLLRERQQLDIRYQDLRFNLLTRRVHLRDLVVGDQDAPAPLVTAGVAQISFPLSAFRGRIDGLNVTLTDVHVNLIREGGRFVTVPAAWTRPRDGDGRTRIPALDAIRLHDATVVYEDRGADLRTETTGLTVDLLPTGDAGELAGPLEPGARTAVRMESRGTVLALISGEAFFSPERAGVNGLVLDSPEGRFTTDVRYAFQGEDRLALAMAATVRADQLSGWFSALEGANGAIDVRLTMPSASGADALADVDVKASSLEWRGVRFRDLDAAGSLSTRAVTLDRARVGIGQGLVEGSATLAWADDAESRASLRGRDIDLRGVLTTLFPDSDAVARFTPASLLDGTFSGTWTGWRAEALDGRATTSWRPAPGHRDAAMRASGRIGMVFRRGPWEFDTGVRINDAFSLQGRWTAVSSRADFNDWPIGGLLAVEGETSGLIGTGLALFQTTPPVDLTQASGQTSGTVGLAGGLTDPAATLVLDGTIEWPDQPAIAFETRAFADADAVRVEVFEARSGPSEAEGALTIDLERDLFDGRFQARAVPVEAWLRRFDVDVPVSGEVDVTGRFTGPTDAYLLEADVRGATMTVAGQAFDDVQVRVQYDGTTVDAASIRAVRGEGAVTGAVRWTRGSGALEGSLAVTTLPFAVDVPTLTPAGETGSAQLAFDVSGRIDLAGTTDALQLNADLAAPQVTLGEHDLGRLELQTRPGEDGAIAFDLRAPSLGASATGSTRLEGSLPFDVSLQVDTPDSSLGATVRGITLDLGAMALQAQAAGMARDRKVERAAVEVARLEGQLLDRTTDPSNGEVLLNFAVNPGTTARYDNDTLSVEAGVRAGRTTLTATGGLGRPDDKLSVTLDGGLEDLRALALRFMPDTLRRAQISGAIAMRAEASGSLDRPALNGTLTISDGLLGDGTRPPLQDIAFDVQLADDQLHIRRGEAHWQGAHLEVTGTVPGWFARLPGASRDVPPASLEGHIDDVTLKVLEPFVPADALQATSFESHVEFTVSATEPSLEAVTGEVLLQRAVLKSRELGLAQRRPGRLRLERGVITLEPWTIGAPWSVATAVTLQGEVRLPDGDRSGDLDVSAGGRLDIRSIGLLFGTYRPDGRSEFDLHIEGPFDAPRLSGLIQVDGAGLVTPQPRMVLSDLTGGIRFEDDRLTVEGMTGSLNGGTVDIGGSMRQPWRGQPDGALTITARGVLVEFRGLRAALDADLTFEKREAQDRYALGGTVTVVQAAYRETLLLTGGLVSLLSPRQDALIVTDEGDSGPQWLALDLRVIAEDTIGVDTTYGEFVAGANLRVAGTAANPRVIGTIDLAPGGELFFGGRRYQVEEGRIEFRGANYLRPQVRLLAHTTIGGYEVTLNVQSEGDSIDTTLSSDPPLPEADIASLMLSGQRQPTGDPGEVVTEQLLAALSGEIVGAVGRAIGFDSVRIEQANPGDLLIDPTLISADSNPAQRVTFSKRVFPDLEVIVSQSLRQSGDVTWVVSWTPLRNLELRVVQLDDDDRSYEVRHDLTFGGGVRPRRRTRTRRDLVQSLELEVRGGVSEADVRRQLRIEQGDRVDFYEWQRARDRVEEWLFRQGFFEARVTTRHDPLAEAKEGTPTPVALRYLVETGPPTALRVVGVDLPGDLQERLRRTWAEIAVDGLLQDAFADVLRPWLAARGHLLPDISLVFSVVQGVKTATLYVEPGPRFPDRALDIHGNEGLSRSAIVSAVEQAGLRDTMWAQPARLQSLLLALYRRNGYLAAEVDVLDPVFEGATARLPVHIAEGPRFRAGTVRVEGVAAVPDVNLDPPIWEGAVLTDRSVAEAIRDLERRFRRAGYRGTIVTAEASTRADGATVDLVFTILVGGRLRLQDIRIAGNRHTSGELIARTTGLERGEPIAWERVGRARDRLYDTGLFRSVNLEIEPVPAEEAGAPGQAIANITVEELPRYRLRYGFQLFDPVSPVIDPRWGSVDPGIVADLTRRGLFGKALTGGVGARINSTERALRTYLSSPTFFGLPVRTNLFLSEDRQKTVSAGNVLDSRSRGITFDQRVRWRQLFQFGYGYNFERRIFDFLLTIPGPIPITVPVEFSANIGRLFGTLVLDDRDNVVDARQGGFHSSSFELGPQALGSTLGFHKYLTQNFYFVPWKRVTFGTAARFELTGGPGRGLITTERLRVGGANTVRGYEDDTLQLQNLTTAADGTTTIVVLNQEIRFPIFGRLMGTTFWDYAHISGERGDFQGLTVRNAVGGGLRLLLPFIVLRVDYGYPVNQDERNRSGRWYFAIGQAF